MTKQYFIQKLFPLCTNAHHDVTFLKVDEIVWNVKKWISRENMPFIWKKAILNPLMPSGNKKVTHT